jgi:hypothetical protein
MMLLLLSLQAGFSRATTVVPANDPGELAHHSSAVFVARAGASRVVEGSILLATATELEVVSVVKGPLSPGDVVESIVPGGAKEGRGWAVAGAPKLVDGEVYLLFADRDSRGRWQPRLMADSVLRREIAEGGSRVFVPLDEASQLSRISGFGPAAPLVPAPVKEQPFIDALDRSLDGAVGWNWTPLIASTDVGLVNALAKDAPAGCVFMEYDVDHLPIRWRTFDSAGSITISADSTPDPSLASGGYPEIQDALNRWKAVSDTSLDIRYGGATADKPSCGEGFDATRNAVVFDDPCDDIADLDGCSGTLGMGGPSFYTSTFTWDSQSWHQASSWFVVVNNGAGCLGSAAYELMMAHELGHGLAFGHTEDSSSLMFGTCCRSHNALDNACTQYLYPAAGSAPTPGRPTNTPTPSNTPTPTWTPTEKPAGPASTPTPIPTGGPTEPSKVTVPVVVHVEGIGGTSWRSDVMVSNQNSNSQTVRFTYQTAAKGAFSKNRTLAGYATLLLEDLVETFFRAGDGRGPLDVEIVNGGMKAPVVVSRAYSENSFGNLGSGLPADVAPSIDVVAMPGLFSDDEFRTNIAVTAGEETTWATFELFKGSNGLVAGGVKRKVEAGDQDQWSIKKLFGTLAEQGVPMTVRVTLSKAGIVYASLIDNDSTDSAVYLGKKPANTWIVPAVARIPGSGGTFWNSSLSLWNSTGVVAWVDMEYLPEKTNNTGGGQLVKNHRLMPYESQNIADVLKDKFDIDNGKGTLIVESTRPITITSRVFTGCESCPQGGTSGNGVRAVPSAALASGETVLPGVRILDGFRSNVGVVTGDKSVSFTFDLRDEGGTLRKTVFKTVPPRTMQQWGIGKLFGSNFVEPDPAGSVIVSGDRPYLTYMTVIDSSSQDPVFVMPQ